LNVWSGYSPMRGPVTLGRVIESAAEMGHERLALTDVNGLYGAPEFYRLAAEAGLRPILGAEIRRGGLSAVALVAAEEGYANLCRIVTRVKREGKVSRVECHEGTETTEHDHEHDPGHEEKPLRSAMSAVPLSNATGATRPGSVPFAKEPFLNDVSALQGGLYWIVEDAPAAAAMLAAGMERGRLYLGIDPAAQDADVRHRLVRAADEMRLPLIATGKAMFIEKDDYEVARVLAAGRCGTTMDGVASAELPHPGAALRSGRRLARQLAECPAAVQANRRLSEECAAWRLLPRRPVFPRFDCPPGTAPAEMLRKLCREAIARRYGRTSDRVEARLAKELGLIERKGFVEYFLVVWDIVQYARRRNAPVAGRGSGASSLVAYLLGITNVCPLSLDIPFERFLHERREDFPDLDIDFCWRIRDDVIGYALSRWGPDRTAMVCTHNLFQERSAFREAAKAFGFSDEQISASGEADIVGPRANRHLAAAARLARRMVGLLHVVSVHPGGIVISPGPMADVAPVEPAPKGVDITQYDKDGVEAVGLVKLDLLGNRSLSTIRAACELIGRHEGVSVDIEALPTSDEPTVAMLREADTVGCNQIESPAMRHLLRAMRPRDVRGLMKALALVRPGAASIGMKEAFIRRTRGLDAVPEGFGPVDALLAETCGVMLYEDDVMLAAAEMLGTNLSVADRFRKAVQKCRGDGERLRLSREFLAGCRAAGVPEDYARSMWVQMAKFNHYSFCRAHAASYAMLAYTSAYLKAHWPTAFWTAALNNNQSMYPPRVYVEQAKRMGVRFALPDVNRSEAEFTVEELPIADCPLPVASGNRPWATGHGQFIRIGLGCIAGLGPAGVETILQTRRGAGPFDSLTEFLARTHLGRQEARNLVQCGAMDFTGRRRPALMMELNLFFSLRPHRASNGGRLLPPRPTIPDTIDDYSCAHKYAQERRILGLSVREHPMALHRPLLAGLTDADSRDLPGRVGRRVRIAGVLEAQRTAQTQTGQTMMFATLDDEYGLFEAVCFPATFAASGPMDRYGPWIVTGKIQEQYGTITVTADAVAYHALKAA
jgi:DNA polymerase III alpha subunit